MKRNKKNSNHSLAFDILREEKRHTWFWFIAFVATLIVSVASYVMRSGVDNG